MYGLYQTLREVETNFKFGHTDNRTTVEHSEIVNIVCMVSIKDDQRPPSSDFLRISKNHKSF